MKNFLLPVSFMFIFMLGLFSPCIYAANIQWDGEAGTTNWDDAMNWAGDVVPGIDDEAIFPSGVGIFTVTSTGTVPDVNGIQVWNGADVTLDLDVTVISSNSNVVKLFNTSILTVKAGRTLDITVTPNSGSILLDKPNASFNVEAGAIVNMNSWRGVTTSADATTATVNNHGIINFTTSNAAIQPNNASALIVINHPCAIMNLLDNKIKIWSNATESTFTNEGLVDYPAGTTAPVSVTNHSASGGAGTNVATNNGFYKVASGNSAAFSSGSGTSNHNGADVTEGLSIDAGTECTVDINGDKDGMAAYTWMAVAAPTTPANSADGALDLTGADFADNTGGTVTISDANCMANSFPVALEVSNVCDEAVLASLPIQLVSFSAEKKGHEVALQWATASEQNTDFFTIERSMNNKDFDAIAKVQAAGNSSEVLRYEAVDTKPVFGKNYYRLKQTDLNGNFEYFEVKVVDFKGDSEVSIYPNPVLDFLTIKTGLQDNLMVQIFDLNGRLIQENRSTVAQAIDVSTLANGMYYFKIINTANQAVIYQDKLTKIGQ